MFKLILLVFKILCFIYIFFWFQLPKKCLGLLIWFMVTPFIRLYKMGCIFCFGKKSDDDFPKKNRSDQTNTSSGKYTQYSTNRTENFPKMNPSGPTVSSSGKYTDDSTNRYESRPHSTALDMPRNPVISQNRTNSFNSDSQYSEEPLQFESLQRTSAKGLSLESPYSMTKDRILEPGGSRSVRPNFKQSGQGDSYDNTLVHQINENRRNLMKCPMTLIHSLPATRLAKTPINDQTISKSYDSILHGNAHANDGSRKSSPESIQILMPTTSTFNPHGRNAYNFLKENKKKKLSSDEESLGTTPTAREEGLPLRPPIGTIGSELSCKASGSSNDMNEQMEIYGSLKRVKRSQIAQCLGLTEDNLSDEYNHKIVNNSAKRFKETLPDKEPTLPDKEPLAHETILAELECILRQRYSESFTSGKVHGFYFEVCTLEESGSVRRKFCSLSELFPPTPEWRMLMYGKPFFGKTQLCHDITVVWHSSSTDKIPDEFANLRDFKILIHHHLKPGCDMDLEKCLVDAYHNMLPQNFVTKNEFKNAWNNFMFQTLFILDGYDELNCSEKRSVYLSLRQNFFKEASILLMCRPDVDDKLKQSFNIHVDICGFNRTMLFEMTNYNSQHLNTFDDCKVEKLYGISPFYAQAIINSFKQVDKPKSLYDLLNSVVNFLTASTTLNDRIFEYIGSLFLDGLKYRRYVFEEEKLRLMLNKSWQDLQTFGLFVACPSKPDETKKLVVSHKLLMVYFSVRYLQEKWKKQIIPAQRDLFLNAQLCFEDSSGVYMATSDKTPKLFFVGIIPEIVFDFQNDVFQMIQDVPEPDLTPAFDTQTLLLRVDSKWLHMFGITEVENPDFQHFFEGILNLLDFWGLTINIKFFVAMNSQLCYLKVVAIDEGTNKPVMMIVASINPTNSDQIEEIHLDFLQSDIKILHLFLQKLVETFFGSCQIDSEMSAVHLVFHLVTRCLAFPRDMHSQLTLGSKLLNSSPLVTWEIMSSSCGKPISSFMYLSEDGTVLRKFNSEECHNLLRGSNPSKVIERMNNSVSQYSELGITINVKSIF